jgi:hypothetical protein
MTLNPYAEHLDQSDPLEVLAATPAQLVAVARRLSDKIDTPLAAGKWSPREIIVHMTDCEIAFGFRLRQGLAGVDIQPFDQDDWAKSYAGYKLADALHCFECLRLWNLALARGLNEADMQKPVTHPERGTMTLRTILETMAGHDLNHLRRLDQL